MLKKHLLKQLEHIGDDDSIGLDDGDRILYDFKLVDAHDDENDTPVTIITE